MKNGEMFDGDTLEQVWPVEKKLEKMYWWGLEPPTANGVRGEK